MSPDAKWALHTFSTFDTPPVYSMVELPNHRVARVMAEEGVDLEEMLEALDQERELYYREHYVQA